MLVAIYQHYDDQTGYPLQLMIALIIGDVAKLTTALFNIELVAKTYERFLMIFGDLLRIRR
ncbi:hypothetical protein O9992_16530 [Vibrio lentus]|nr:hypothetical protein [Vibrio lentus]